ncbi:MAG: NmrA family NAD(P)-binding protein [Actinomycetota bacterium]|nr:NmrA family NAD(P)-binding protein [Actinomycetota bacterium]
MTAVTGEPNAGVAVVVSVIHGFAGTAGASPSTVDRDGNRHLVDAAARAGADVVLVSVVGARADSPMELFRMKYAAELHLRSTEVPSTVVRSAAFLELWVELMQGTARRSGRPLVFGRGDNPINFVSVTDVAAAVERAVVDPQTRGRTLEVVGPHDLTFNQLALAVQRAAGRTAPPRHVPPAALRLMAQTVGRVKPELGRQARAALAMDRLDLSAERLAPSDRGAVSADDVLAQEVPPGQQQQHRAVPH